MLQFSCLLHFTQIVFFVVILMHRSLSLFTCLLESWRGKFHPIAGNYLGNRHLGSLQEVSAKDEIIHTRFLQLILLSWLKISVATDLPVTQDPYKSGGNLSHMDGLVVRMTASLRRFLATPVWKACWGRRGLLVTSHIVGWSYEWSIFGKVAWQRDPFIPSCDANLPSRCFFLLFLFLPHPSSRIHTIQQESLAFPSLFSLLFPSLIQLLLSLTVCYRRHLHCSS